QYLHEIYSYLTSTAPQTSYRSLHRSVPLTDRSQAPGHSSLDLPATFPQTTRWRLSAQRTGTAWEMTGTWPAIDRRLPAGDRSSPATLWLRSIPRRGRRPNPGRLAEPARTA